MGGLLFIGGTDRKVHALDARTGCTLWTFAIDAAVRAAITVAPLPGSDQFAIFFGDLRANAYAVNALTGALIWKTKPRDQWVQSRLTAGLVIRKTAAAAPTMPNATRSQRPLVAGRGSARWRRRQASTPAMPTGTAI